ncbi:cytochrome P450 20A1-like [Haliotis rufescens]|uniref:cytochrome P450 20A1-like n=1 Tax=Haliotis rufescens TaxID=6454 RepID=UPI001EB09AB0|nr:cytochrome P450 20A1-like [Haliotis rufescens]
MLAFLIFAATFVVVLIIAVIYIYPKSSAKGTTVPGLSPTTTEDGNLADIRRAGSLHEFLMDLHQQFGPIASFWMGPQLVVSIASAELFKQHQNVFDRPPELFRLFEPLIGAKCIQYANGGDGRARRTAYDKSFSHEELKMYYPNLQKVTDGLVNKWSSMVKEEHIPLGQYMFAFSIKAALITLLGDCFENDKEILSFKTHYDLVWSEMEHRLADPTIPDDDSPRAKTFSESRKKVIDSVMKSVEHRKKHGSKSEEHLLIDRILDHHTDIDVGHSDCLTYLVGGFHTTGNLLTWAFYFLATHQDIQEKVFKEVIKVLGQDDTVEHHNLNDLKYLRQVIDETLRCAVVAPWAARFQDFDSELGGHKIPKNTPVIHALGVMLQDETVWPLPNKFDPDRLSTEQSKGRPSLAFSPFGFAGKRICPGYRFAYVETTMCLATLIRKFKVNLVEGQVVKPEFGLVTHPVDEIWITVSKRK